MNYEITSDDKLKMFIRDEINLAIKDINDKSKDQVNSIKNDLSYRLDDICNKHDKISIKLDELNNMVNKDKAYVDRINDLLTFQRKTQDNLNSHEIKLNGIQKNLKDACYKYDKIYLDNLNVPGVIGDFCKFKTLRDYIESSIHQVQSLNIFRDKHIIELNTYKDKLDCMIRSITNQLESIEKNMKNYTIKMIEGCEKSIKYEITNQNNRIGELRLENNKAIYDIHKLIKDLNIEYDRITKIKEEIGKDFHNSVDQMKDAHKETQDCLDAYKEEFSKIKTRFVDLSEFIKDVRFRKNLQVEVDKKEIKQLANHIGFKKMKKKYVSKIELYNENHNDNPDAESEVKRYIEGIVESKDEIFHNLENNMNQVHSDGEQLRQSRNLEKISEFYNMQTSEFKPDTSKSRKSSKNENPNKTINSILNKNKIRSSSSKKENIHETNSQIKNEKIKTENKLNDKKEKVPRENRLYEYKSNGVNNKNISNKSTFEASTDKKNESINYPNIEKIIPERIIESGNTITEYRTKREIMMNRTTHNIKQKYFDKIEERDEHNHDKEQEYESEDHESSNEEKNPGNNELSLKLDYNIKSNRINNNSCSKDNNIENRLSHYKRNSESEKKISGINNLKKRKDDNNNKSSSPMNAIKNIQTHNEKMLYDYIIQNQHEKSELSNNNSDINIQGFRKIQQISKQNKSSDKFINSQNTSNLPSLENKKEIEEDKVRYIQLASLYENGIQYLYEK